MREFDDFLIDTSEARAEMKEQLANEMDQYNGVSFKLEKILEITTEIAFKIVGKIVFDQLRFYHEWLSDELSGQKRVGSRPRTTLSESNLVKIDFSPKGSDSGESD